MLGEQHRGEHAPEADLAEPQPVDVEVDQTGAAEQQQHQRSPATTSRIRVRRVSVGAPTGGRMATGHAPVVRVFGAGRPCRPDRDLAPRRLLRSPWRPVRRHALLTQLYGRGVGFPFGPRMSEIPVHGRRSAGRVRLRIAAPRGAATASCSVPTRTQLQAAGRWRTASAQFVRRHAGTRWRPRRGPRRILNGMPPIGPTPPSGVIAPVPATNRPPVSSPGVSLSTTAEREHQPGRRAADAAEADPDVAVARLDPGRDAQQPLLAVRARAAAPTSASRLLPGPPVGDRRPTAPARCRTSASGHGHRESTGRPDTATSSSPASSVPAAGESGDQLADHDPGRQRQLGQRGRLGVGLRRGELVRCSPAAPARRSCPAGRRRRAAPPGGRRTRPLAQGAEQGEPVGDRHRGHVQVPGRRVDRQAVDRDDRGAVDVPRVS